MRDPVVLLDPTSESAFADRALLPRPESLDGITVGILDIGKSRGDVFLDQVDALLRKRGVAVRRYAKPTFSRPASTALRQQIAAQCQVLVEGLAD